MPKFKKGDNVRAIGLSIYGADLRGKELIVDDPEYHSCDGVVVKVTGDYLMRPTDLEHVKKSHAARILTEKVTIDGVPCRKILGFEGIMREECLPKKYLDSTPCFWLDSDCGGRHIFNGKMGWEESWEWKGNGIRLELPSGCKIDVGCFGFTGIQEGSVWSETTFQELLTWLRRAGSRLAKIRKQEKAAWSGKETVDI